MSGRENWMASMPGRTNWTRAMLERLQKLHRQGESDHEISNTLFLEFNAPRNVGEVIADLKMLETGNTSFSRLTKSWLFC